MYYLTARLNPMDCNNQTNTLDYLLEPGWSRQPNFCTTGIVWQRHCLTWAAPTVQAVAQHTVHNHHSSAWPVLEPHHKPKMRTPQMLSTVRWGTPSLQLCRSNGWALSDNTETLKLSGTTHRNGRAPASTLEAINTSAYPKSLSSRPRSILMAEALRTPTMTPGHSTTTEEQGWTPTIS